MATWGEFQSAVTVTKMPNGKMYVSVDDAIELFEEKTKLKEAVTRLESAVAEERETCAKEIEMFADACQEEANPFNDVVSVLRAAATFLRQQGDKDKEASEEEELEMEDETT